MNTNSYGTNYGKIQHSDEEEESVKKPVQNNNDGYNSMEEFEKLEEE